MTEGKRWRCGKCLMGFQVREATRADCERLRCPDCGLGFWSTHNNTNGRCVVGIDPQEEAA